MDIHQNARLTPHGRAELVRRVLVRGQTPKAVATALGVNVKTVSKWCERFRAEGTAGLVDRSSRPHRLRQPTPDATGKPALGEHQSESAMAEQLGVSERPLGRPPRVCAAGSIVLCRISSGSSAWRGRPPGPLPPLRSSGP